MILACWLVISTIGARGASLFVNAAAWWWQTQSWLSVGKLGNRLQVVSPAPPDLFFRGYTFDLSTFKYGLQGSSRLAGDHYLVHSPFPEADSWWVGQGATALLSGEPRSPRHSACSGSSLLLGRALARQKTTAFSALLLPVRGRLFGECDPALFMANCGLAVITLSGTRRVACSSGLRFPGMFIKVILQLVTNWPY